jgi:imidazolonepropionase-like amidohydrolase
MRTAPALALVLPLLSACARDPLLVARPADAPRSVVIRAVRVFDAPAAALRDGFSDVVVRDGRIAAIAAPGVAAPGLVEIDGRGGTLLPGLVDVHTHPGATSDPPGTVTLPDVADNLAAFLYAGVTTALDLGGMSPEGFRERERVAKGERLGPRLYVAGPIFTAPGGHPAEVLRESLPWYLRWYVVSRATREVATPADARAAVAALLPERPDVLKIAVDAGTGAVPCLGPETIAAITTAGRSAGLRSIIHVGSSAEAIAAVRGGADALAHAPWRDELSEEALAALAVARVPVVVTLTVWDMIEAPRTDFLPIEREIGRPELLAAFGQPAQGLDPAFVRLVRDTHAARRRNVAKLRAAGIRVLAGSDACNAANLPGAGLHVELAKLVEAGLTPGEALRAATAENARFLAGDAADFGTIAVGQRADLVLVAGDPTARITDLGRIAHVVLDGAVLTRRPRRG